MPEHTEEIRARGEARVAHLLRTDPDGAWAAVDGGRLVGVALASRRGPLWFLSLLTVEPGQQGRGVGARLLESARRTEEGATAGLLIGSQDPRALRRYALAGFALHPGYGARGRVDRSALPAGLGARETDVDGAADLLEDVVARLRGVGHGPDLEVMQAVGLRAGVVEDGRERGFCLWAPGRVVAAGGSSPAVAQRALWAGLAAMDGETEVHHLTGDQQWAVDVVVAARLALRPGESSCRRGALGPMTPYLPTGAYG